MLQDHTLFWLPGVVLKLPYILQQIGPKFTASVTSLEGVEMVHQGDVVQGMWHGRQMNPRFISEVDIMAHSTHFILRMLSFGWVEMSLGN
jgi:hypothetical protein